MNHLTKIVIILGIIIMASCADDTTTPTNNTQQPPTNNRRQPDIGIPSDMVEMSEDATDDMVEGQDMQMSTCRPGTVLGCESDRAQLVCGQDGQTSETRQCPGELKCNLGECTDMLCSPTTTMCEGANAYRRCAADGKSYEASVDCPPDTLCDRGLCKSSCQLGKYRASYIGCEYWTVDLDQYKDPATNPKPDEVPHAVVISNPNDKPATIAFYSQATSISVADPVVPPLSAKSFTMPRLDISGTGVSNRGINIVSTIPVVAHQFNPLNNERVYSNDASLLLPVNTLGTDYYVLNWPSSIIPCILMPCPAPQLSYVTIIATSPGDTFVNVTPSTTIAAGGGINPFGKGVTRSFKLRRGDVLNLEANDGMSFNPNDLTGTFIKSDKPIAVFSGHEEAVIGDRERAGDMSCCADHLEQQLFPLSTWGKRYMATLSPGRGTKRDHWRIIAGEDGVVLTTNPPQPGANGVTLNKGEFVKFYSDQNFEVSATGKVLVGQFLVSQQATSAVTGDPAFILTVPVEAYRKDYTLLTPNGYNKNFVSITRPKGVVVKLNGQAVTASFVAIANTNFEVAAVEVQPGVQTLESTEPFGIEAYGFDNAVSYGYPGGLNIIGQAAPGN